MKLFQMIDETIDLMQVNEGIKLKIKGRYRINLTKDAITWDKSEKCDKHESLTTISLSTDIHHGEKPTYIFTSTPTSPLKTFF